MADIDSSVPDPVAAVSTLGEPNRRSLYDYVVAAGGWVGRDQAVDATGLQRGIVAHHLDRLVEDGLLDVDFQRLSGRTGPGAGRPAKLYRRSLRDIVITLPPRHYELAGRLLADAVADSQSTGVDVGRAVAAAAAAAGRRMGEEMRDRMGRRRSADGARDAALQILSEQGFEPVEDDDGTVLLRNCPFHLLAQHQTELVCGMNLCLISAALDELDSSGFEATLEPDPEMCCVRLHRV
ncbi:MAG: transcriptional regulator [Ilumatobacteraceae bacterium]